jgi:UDP-N-acetylglucosamine--N-acetylmuramyl-(pentapeptide) pyrophosphoryl-undecaprenol N-acetylglucosamine transferase
VPSLLAGLERRGVAVEALHQTGARQVETLSQTYARLALRATVVPRLDSMAEAYNWASFVIARAGAGTLAELALSALPALLVPLADAAADHQAANARAFAEAGAAIWVREQRWHSEDLVERVGSVLGNPTTWQAMSDRARTLARPDAARLIVDDTELLMRGRW